MDNRSQPTTFTRVRHDRYNDGKLDCTDEWMRTADLREEKAIFRLSKSSRIISLQPRGIQGNVSRLWSLNAMDILEKNEQREINRLNEK